MNAELCRALSLWLAIAALFYSGDLHADATSGEFYAIPTGQEELVLEMLGRDVDLPDGCTVQGASIEVSTIIANYACTNGPARILLEHPDVGKQELGRTTAFSLVAGEPAPSRALVDAVGANVRTHEGRFQWKLVTKPGRSGSTAHDSKGTIFGLLGLVASLGLVAFVTWRRKRRPELDAQTPTMAAEESAESAET